MNYLLTLARGVRHAPGFRRAEKLWDWLRPAFHRALDPFNRGIGITLGGRQIRVPPELLGTNPDWTNYERESFAALGAWLDRTPGSLTMLDIGCSFGVVTSFVLQICPRSEVVAFDSDLISLRALEAVVPASMHKRLRRINGLLGSEHRSGQSFAKAISATLARLPEIPPRAAISRSYFICFGENGSEALPQHQLDTLLEGVTFPGPVLLKCDVEGAELLVLAGATGLIRRLRPIMLLSVHPLLPDCGHVADGVASFLREHDYRWRLIARDHEEHWWCEPIA